ncbi:aldo/keto reductase [Paenibacillus glycanilyticus]|nr:aldo/keto reductase [Paenibacillus glycanilyticus]
MDAYVASGGNMIDTAEVYANWLPGTQSISECTIGNWMKSRGNRNNLIVTTKGAHPRLPTMEISRMSREEITEDVDGSLRRLQVDTIDLYWLHRDDRNRHAGEILDTLNNLVKEGKIRYFGCSNWTANRIQEAQLYAESHGLQSFSANQPMWSLASVDPSAMEDRTLVVMDEELLHLHRLDQLEDSLKADKVRFTEAEIAYLTLLDDET